MRGFRPMDPYDSARRADPAPPISDHFDGRAFRNPDGVPAGRSLTDVLRWKLTGGPLVPWPARPDPEAVSPALLASVNPGELAATFVGHSTFLLQFSGGLNVLTDPVWSDRVSPVSFAGPRRVRPPALAFNALPPIAVVLVSHGHYDHMDLPTLRRLEAKFHPLFLTGLGNRALLRKQGLENVAELDWWQSHHLPGHDVEATFTPAQHWSARGVTNRNRTLWGGFWLRQSALQVFFAADSGLGRHFELIHERLGTPTIAFLPIGAYEPRWFMREQHMNPDEAVQVHLTLAAENSVGMHFGTFRLTDEGIDEPARALAVSLQVRGVPPANFRVPRFGETLRFAPRPLSPG